MLFTVASASSNVKPSVVPVTYEPSSGCVLPRTVIVVTVKSAYFHCSKALVRSDLWNPQRHVSRERLPSAGQMHRRLSGGTFDAETYDQELPQRTAAGLY